MPVIIEFSRCIGTYSSAKFELLIKYYIDNVQIKKVEAIWAGCSRKNVYFASLLNYIVQFTMVFVLYVSPSVIYCTYRNGYCEELTISEIFTIIKVLFISVLFIVAVVSLLHAIMFCCNNAAKVYLPLLMIGNMIIMIPSELLFPRGTEISPDILYYSLIFIGRKLTETNPNIYEYFILSFTLVLRIAVYNCIGLYVFNRKEIA